MPLLRTPWYHGWTVVAVAVVYQALIFGIAIYSFTFWIPYWEEEFAVGRADIMIIFVCLQAGMAILSPFVGRAADSYSIRWLVIAGGMCFSASLVASSYAESLWQIGIIFCVLMVPGLVLAGPVTALTLAARWFDRNSGMALGVVSTGTSIGGLLLPLIIVSLQTELGWRIANLWLAGFVLLLITPLSFLIYNSPSNAGLGTDKSTDQLVDTGSDNSSHASSLWTTRQILGTSTFWAMVFCFAVVTAIFLAIQQNLAPLAQDGGISVAAASSIVSIMAFVMIGAKLLFGYYADRIKHRILYLVTVGTLVAVLLILSFMPIDYLTLLVASCLSGVAAGSVIPLIGAIIRHRYGPLSFGRVKGLTLAFVNVSALGPWIAGAIYDSTGTYSMAWVVLGVALVPAALASFKLSQSGWRA